MENKYLNEKNETLGRETLSKNSTVKTNIRKPALHIKNGKRKGTISHYESTCRKIGVN